MLSRDLTEIRDMADLDHRDGSVHEKISWPLGRVFMAYPVASPNVRMNIYIYIGMHVCICIFLLCINGFLNVYALPACMHHNTCVPGACGSWESVEEFRSTPL